MPERFLQSFADAKSKFERQPGHDPALVCRVGPHMNCAVLKLQKAAWTNDDLSKMGNQTGIFFSVWTGKAAASKNRADYNIHAMALRQLRSYRLTGHEFSNRFREAFDQRRSTWPNVSTDFGCCTLMQGWFDIHEKSMARDVLKLMDQFAGEVAPIIDDLLSRRNKRRIPATKASRKPH